MKKKMLKAIKDLNAYIDDDREKLCDRIHDLELSHKRMERLLRCFIRMMKYSYMDTNTEQNYLVYMSLCKFYADVKKELSYPYFRKNYKVKGGKDA